MQHITQGEILQSSYSSFLKANIKSAGNMYVRSTNYDRTLQSAAALLTTLVPGVSTADKPVSEPLHVLVCPVTQFVEL